MICAIFVYWPNEGLGLPKFLLPPYRLPTLAGHPEHCQPICHLCTDFAQIANSYFIRSVQLSWWDAGLIVYLTDGYSMLRCFIMASYIIL